MNNQFINPQNNQPNNVLSPQQINPQGSVNNQTPVTNNNNNNNKKGSGTGFYKFIIVILLICCLGMGGYLVYTNVLANKKETVKTDTSEALEKVNIDGDSILESEDTIKTFETAFNDSASNFFGYIYDDKEIKVKSFDKNAALFAALYEYLDESTEISYAANNLVKTKYKALFGSNLLYVPTDVNAGLNYEIKYDASTKYYSYQRVGLGGFFYPTYISFNDSSTISNEKIEIVKRVGYVEYSDDHTKVYVYKDKNKGDKIAELPVADGAFSPVEIREKYKSSLTQYKYTFVKAGENFVFDSIERTN